MKKTEYKTLKNLIKANYPQFELTDEEDKLWAETLMPYSYHDLSNKLTQHLEGEWAKILPRLHFLTTGITKEGQAQGYITCRKCGALFNLNNDNKWLECETKCNIYCYVERKTKQFDIDLDKIMGNMYQLTLYELERRYDDFLKEIIKQERNQKLLTEDERNSFRTMIRKGVITL